MSSKNNNFSLSRENSLSREKSLSKALELAFEKPSVKGLLCADSNGLLIAGSYKLLWRYFNLKLT